jgi:hypothetical protein
MTRHTRSTRYVHISGCFRWSTHSGLSANIEPTPPSYLTRSAAAAVTKRRYMIAYKVLLENAVFSKPLIVMDIPDGTSVLDGNHRVAAFCFLRRAPNNAFTTIKLKRPPALHYTWVGTHTHGEVPLDLPPWLD